MAKGEKNLRFSLFSILRKVPIKTPKWQNTFSVHRTVMMVFFFLIFSFSPKKILSEKRGTNFDITVQTLEREKNKGGDEHRVSYRGSHLPLQIYTCVLMGFL